MEEKKLDINSIIGFVLIFAILMFMLWQNQPTPEELEAQEKAKQEQLSPTDIPKRLFIISDIDFESASGETVNFDIIDKKFESLGYKRPDITFWNLCGSLKVLRHTSGSVLISGFHSSILDVILRGENPDLIRIMKRTLDQYNVIELEI